MPTIEHDPQKRTENGVRKANMIDGWSLMARTVDADGAVRLRYSDGAVAVIARDGALSWEGPERR